MPRQHYATILDEDMPPAGDRYQVATYAYSLDNLETRYFTRTFPRRVETWDPVRLDETTLTHVPTGDRFSAGIYRMDPTP
ncbi:MAG: hypothetical protein DHS20C11_11510 [Lysobacteraceae bacterium]|nr:MAG: hypothetical protein DHS20C11_11510 [Xanthomonadaceae bacterium]